MGRRIPLTEVLHPIHRPYHTPIDPIPARQPLLRTRRAKDDHSLDRRTLGQDRHQLVQRLHAAAHRRQLGVLDNVLHSVPAQGVVERHARHAVRVDRKIR